MMCMSSSSEAKPASPSSPANNSSGHVSRDPSWLKLDVCPEYLSQSCLRKEEDCPLAHPSSNVNVAEGTVTCCFDFIKDRCQRTNCRYYHPPPLIKDQLVAAGKMHAQSKSRSKELSALAPEFHLYTPNEGTPFSPLLPPYSLPYCEKVEVCREFMRGRCHRTVHECRFYHPEHHTIVDPQNMVMVCPTLATVGSCKVNRCPYGHPLSHHKLQRVMLNPFPPYPVSNGYLPAHQMAMGAPYYPMVSSYQYPPSIVYPGTIPTSLYSNQFAQMVPMSYRPYSSSPALWTPTSGVFFGADYVGGVDLYSSAGGFSTELENKTIRMERQLGLKNTVEFVDNQN